MSKSDFEVKKIRRKYIKTQCKKSKKGKFKTKEKIIYFWTGEDTILGGGDAAGLVGQHLHKLGLDRGRVDALVMEELLHLLCNL